MFFLCRKLSNATITIHKVYYPPPPPPPPPPLPQFIVFYVTRTLHIKENLKQFQKHFYLDKGGDHLGFPFDKKKHNLYTGSCKGHSEYLVFAQQIRFLRRSDLKCMPNRA